MAQTATSISSLEGNGVTKKNGLGGLFKAKNSLNYYFNRYIIQYSIKKINVKDPKYYETKLLQN